MRNKRLFIFIAVFIVLGLVACSSDITSSDTGRSSKIQRGRFTYTVNFMVMKNIGKEFELWSKYHEENMRIYLLNFPAILQNF